MSKIKGIPSYPPPPSGQGWGEGSLANANHPQTLTLTLFRRRGYRKGFSSNCSKDCLGPLLSKITSPNTCLEGTVSISDNPRRMQ